MAPIVWEDAEWAKELRPFLVHASRKIRVLHPCAGINAPERAARELAMPWVSTGDYEVKPCLWGPLSKVSSNIDALHVGPRTGNVLAVDIDSLDLTTDAVVAGPPCPPFSSMGARLVECDVRSSVFLTICVWILHLSRKGCLWFFVLENVMGVTKRKAGCELSFGKWIMNELQSELGVDWRIRAVQGNSSDCGLPQSRPRVFIIGTCPQLHSTRRLDRISLQPPLVRPKVSLLSFLDMQQSPHDWDQLTVRQQVNAMEYMARFEAMLRAGTAQSEIAVVDVARDPLRAVDSCVVVDGTATLRTNSANIWLIPGPSMQAQFGVRGRLLNRDEKSRLAGVRPESMSDLTRIQLEEAIGNTIPVALIGSVLFPLLRAWVEAQMTIAQPASADSSSSNTHA